MADPKQSASFKDFTLANSGLLDLDGATCKYEILVPASSGSLRVLPTITANEHQPHPADDLEMQISKAANHEYSHRVASQNDGPELLVTHTASKTAHRMLHPGGFFSF